MASSSESTHEEPQKGTTSSTYMTLQESSDLFQEVMKDSNIFNAYKSFNSAPIC